MAISLRIEPLLEKELELAAKRKGVTKTQFVIDAIERALDRKNPYELLMKIKAEEEARGQGLIDAFDGVEQPYDTVQSRETLVAALKNKHGVGGAD